MKRNLGRLAAVVAVTAMAFATAARADDGPRCEDEGGAREYPGSAFGGYQIGQDASCEGKVLRPGKDSRNCTLSDAMGVEYGVHDGRVGYISLYTSAKTRALPFGLKHNLGVAAFIDTYYRQADDGQSGPNLTIVSGENGYSMVTDPCLVGANGVPFTAIFHFDNTNHFYKIEYGGGE